MGISVACHEEIPFSSEAEVEAAVAADPLLAEFEESSINTGQHAFDLCAAWGAGIAPAVENQPIRSAIPTLVMSGEYDPITPPAWGKATAANLSNGLFFEFPGVGHAVTVEDDCPLGIAIAFLDHPSVSPDSSCISGMEGPDFAVPGKAQPVTLQTVTAELEGGVTLKLAVPQEWTEQFPGVYARGSTLVDQTVLVVIGVPGFTGAEVLDLLGSQLSSQAVTLTEAGSFLAASLTWQRHRGNLQGSEVDIGVADAQDMGLLVMLISDADQRGSLVSTVFEPAMESIELA